METLFGAEIDKEFVRKPIITHITKLRGKSYNDRIIEHAIEFTHRNSFVLVISMMDYLKELGYSVGLKNFSDPIGFSYTTKIDESLYNLSDKQLNALDGLILLNQNSEGYYIIFFTPPRY